MSARRLPLAELPDWPRLMTAAVAAAYCGRSETAFTEAVASGVLPKASGRYWDRKLIDAALDRMSGIAGPSAEDMILEALNGRRRG